jgi:hypothetical protein
VAEFAECFVKVPLSLEISSDRSLYLLGTTPRWEDMHRGLDAPRTLTDSIFAHVVDELDRESGAIVGCSWDCWLWQKHDLAPSWY